MNRKDFYFKQKVTEAELDTAFDDAENAIRALVTDLGFIGITYGLEVAEQPSPNLTVQVATGGAFDQTGRRIAVASTQNLDLSVDESALNTAVVTPGNERWLSVFIEFDRTLSDPRVDGNSVTVYFQRNESFNLNVAMGSEALIGVATRPPLRDDQLLLADVYLINGQTTITDADISTTRRELQAFPLLSAQVAAIEADGWVTAIRIADGVIEVAKLGAALTARLAKLGTGGTYLSTLQTVSTATATVSANVDLVEVTYSAAACTVTLPTAANAPIGTVIQVSKANTGTFKITVTPDSGSSINGAAADASVDIPSSTIASATGAADIVAQFRRTGASTWRMA